MSFVNNFVLKFFYLIPFYKFNLYTQKFVCFSLYHAHLKKKNSFTTFINQLTAATANDNLLSHQIHYS